MPDDIGDAVGNEPVGNGNSLLRIRGVIAKGQDHLFAVDAAIRIDRLGCHRGAATELFAHGRVRPGQRPGNSDQYLGLCRLGAGQEA